MGSFNVAFLIMGHKNEAQIARLVSVLRSSRSTCFVHVDAESDIDVCRLGGGVPVRNRLHGILGHFSLVEIAGELMREALSYGRDKGIKYSYFYLISGQDYPLVSVGKIINELEKTYPKPFIDCTPWSSDNWVGSGSSHCPWFISTMRRVDEAMKRGPMRRAVKLPLLVADTIGRRFSSPKLIADRRGVSLYGGSAWWLLPDDMIEYALHTLSDDVDKARFEMIKWVAAPEEMYFQTVLMNSPFRGRIEVNSKNVIAQNCKTYANFNPAGKPFTGHPYIFTIEDVDELETLSGDHYFARKFDATVDDDVLDRLDETIAGEQKGWSVENQKG